MHNKHANIWYIMKEMMNKNVFRHYLKLVVSQPCTVCVCWVITPQSACGSEVCPALLLCCEMILTKHHFTITAYCVCRLRSDVASSEG